MLNVEKYKSFGNDSRIHDTAIINHPELIEIANHVSIDIGVYCSTQLKVGNFVHIAPYVCIIGGKGSSLIMGDYSGISAGCKIVCASDDFKNSLLNPQVPQRYRTTKSSPIVFEKYTCVGTNSVIMQGVTLKEGSVVGANSLLLKDTEEWGVYAGNPTVKIGVRNKDNVIKDIEEIEMIEKYKNIRIADGKFGKDELPKKARLLCLTVGCVGNIGFVINQLYFMKGYCEEIYIDIEKDKKKRAKWAGTNPYDMVLDQKLTDDYTAVSCWGNELFDYDSIILEDIRNTVKPYFKFELVLVNIVNDFIDDNDIGKNTLGVHVRMSDMNAWHGDQFGFIYYEDYTREIDTVLKNNPNVDKIFISSDNEETLGNLMKRYEGVAVCHENISRTPNEHDEGDEDELRVKGFERLSGEFNFYTPFVDMLTLTKCGYFIGRKFSNFSCAAIMLGEMKFKNIINLH